MQAQGEAALQRVVDAAKSANLAAQVANAAAQAATFAGQGANGAVQVAAGLLVRPRHSAGSADVTI